MLLRSRRQLGAFGMGVLATRVTWASTPIIKVPITLHVPANPKGALTPSNITEGLALAERLLGIGFVIASEKPLADAQRKQESRTDRNALSSFLWPGTIDVFGVESLRDVDDPSRYRRGVAWTTSSRPARGPYIILSEIAGTYVLAHELGHYFGLRHVQTRNNLMSYDRDGGQEFIDETQQQTVKKSLAWQLRSKQLMAVGE